MNNLQFVIKKLGYQGGTVHQIAKELDLDATDLLIMPQYELGAILDKREYLKRATIFHKYEKKCDREARLGGHHVWHKLYVAPEMDIGSMLTESKK